MRLCTYTVVYDFGFAPNPFWSYCTLAVCTPNHMGIRAKTGDWFAGFEEVSRGSKLIYAMRVSEVKAFDDYYRDRRFRRKKPVLDGTWRQRLGDNIYYREGNRWKQLRSPFHQSAQQRVQDTKHPQVFVAEEFYYFGANAIAVPARFKMLIKKGQGCKCSHSPTLVEGFLEWLRSSHRAGRHANPRDREPGVGRTCKPRVRRC